MLRKGLFKKPQIKLEAGGVEIKAPAQCVCAGCKKPVLKTELMKSMQLCPLCGHHHRIPARERLSLLCDPGSFSEWDFSEKDDTAHSFPGYAEKLRDAAEKSGESEAVLCGKGRISGQEAALFAMDHRFLMGSMGAAVGERLALTFERATEQRLPVIGFTLSGGARMQEGIISLMQMAKVSAAVRRHSDAGLLYIAVLTDPTAGGVTASFAMLADIIFAEPGALICFAGPRVIEQTIRQKLPEGFQRAEFLQEKGFLDGIVPRGKQRELLGELLLMHGEPKAEVKTNDRI